MKKKILYMCVLCNEDYKDGLTPYKIISRGSDTKAKCDFCKKKKNVYIVQFGDEED